jgi:DNA-directed RNA polymerase subunit omega
VARITVEDCLELVENRFQLVHLAAQRTKQLRRGSNSMADSPENKEVVQALREIAAGKVSFENINELIVPEQDIFEVYSEELEQEQIIDAEEDDLEVVEGEAGDEEEEEP